MADDARYRLEPLRGVRARDEHGKRGELADAVTDAARAAAGVAAAEARVAAARARLVAATDGEASRLAPRSASTAALGDRFMARRRSELAAAEVELAHAHQARDARDGVVDSARTGLATARAGREVVERHFAAWRAAQRKAAERRED